MTTKHYILALLSGFMALDILGFIAWSISGQVPVDGFFMGAITKAVLSFIF